MEKYLLIRANLKLSKIEIDEIISVFSDAFGIIKTDIIENVILLKYHSNDDFSIKDIVNGINLELFVDTFVFSSTVEYTEEHFKWAFNLFSNISFNPDEFYLEEKDLIRRSLEKDVSIETKKYALKEYYYDKEFQHILKVFMECNMNTSKAADLLFIHRNTLINKLDKFVEVTGFDIRNFKDAILIYCMIE